MTVKEERYSLPMQALHWLTAICIIGLIVAGAVRHFNGSAVGGAITESFGVLTLIIVSVRVVVRLRSRVPPLRTSQRYGASMKKAAFAVHMALYVAMVTCSYSGWVMTSAEGRRAPFFGLFSLPPIAPENHAIYEIAGYAHTASLYTLCGLLLMHLLGVAYHQTILKDKLIRRMTPDCLR